MTAPVDITAIGPTVVVAEVTTACVTPVVESNVSSVTAMEHELAAEFEKLC